MFDVYKLQKIREQKGGKSSIGLGNPLIGIISIFHALRGAWPMSDFYWPSRTGKNGRRAIKIPLDY